MKQDKNQKCYDYAVCIIFMCLIILPSVIWGGIKAMAHFYPEINDAVDYDIGENRKKAKFPTEFNIDTITVELEQYYNDHVPFRSSIITINNTMTNAAEDVYKAKIRPVLVSVLYGTNEGEKKEQEYLPPNIINEKVIEGREEWLFYYGDNSENYYLGNNLMTEEEMRNYTERIVILSELCEKKGIKFQMIIMPNKEQVYDEYMPSYTIVNEYKRVQRLVDYIKDNSEIEVMYLLEEIRSAKKYGQLYYQCDTHWNELGAFIGVQELYKSLGIKTTSMEDIIYSDKSVSGGDLIGLGALNASKYTKDIGYDVEYKEEISFLEETKEYADENEETYKYVNIESEAKEQRKLVLIGDSFRTAMVPYLAKDFADASIIYRDVVGKEMANNEIKNAEILVLELVERYDYLALSTINKLIEILSEDI